MNRRHLVLALAAGALTAGTVALQHTACAQNNKKKVLVLTHAAGFKHSSRPAAAETVRRLGNETGDWEVFGVADNQDQVRSYINATSRIEIDAFFRHRTSLPQPAVEAYQELDARLGYRVRPGWDLSLIGTSLLHPRHLEFRAGTAPETYERSVALRSVWRF